LSKDITLEIEKSVGFFPPLAWYEEESPYKPEVFNLRSKHLIAGKEWEL
jgi:hypothetical protein